MANILHVIDTTGPGGAETIFVELADRLRQRGHTSVVTIRGEGWVADTLRKRGLEPIMLDCKGSFNISFLLALRRLVREHEIDIVQSHLLGSNVYCALLGLITGIPVIGVFHGVVDIAPNERFTGLKRAAMNYGLTRCVAVCQGLADSIHDLKLLNPLKTTVVYNGVDISRYENAADLQLKDRLGLPADSILAGCLGNIRPAKAYDVLIKALPAIIKEHPGFHVAIAGQGDNSLHAELVALAENLDVTAHIHFLGFCENSAEFLASIDFFLLPSRSEGFPVSVIEALATNLPVLATHCVGTAEILTHGQNGWLVAADDVAALHEGLRIFIEGKIVPSWNEQRASAMPFRMDNMLDSYAQIYQNALTKKNR